MDPVEILCRAMTGGFVRDDPAFRVAAEHNARRADKIHAILRHGGYRIIHDPERTPVMNIGARLAYGYDLGYPAMSGHLLVPTFTVETDDEYDGPVDLDVFDWYHPGYDLTDAVNTELHRIAGTPDSVIDDTADDPDLVLRDLGIAVVTYGVECAGKALVTWTSEESDLNGLVAVDAERAVDLRFAQDWDVRLADTLRWLRCTVKDQSNPRWLPLPTSYY